MNELELTKAIASVLDKKKAIDIKAIHITEYSIVADYFLVASGTSNTHVKSLADDVEYELKQLGVEPDHIEGRATGWILLDYGDVVVHVLNEQARSFYDLERLWADGEKIDITDIIG